MKIQLFRDSGKFSSKLQLRCLPGAIALFFSISAHSIGLLEPLELIAFDFMMMMRPEESPDSRISLIEIKQADIERWGGYPIDVQHFHKLIQNIQIHNPKIIGLNILEDILQDEDEFISGSLKYKKNIIIADKILPPQIKALPIKGVQESGFVDILIDRDNRLRRILFGTINPVNSGKFEFSFSFQLARFFLEDEGFRLANGIENPEAMRFGRIESPGTDANVESYVNIDVGVEFPVIDKNFGGYVNIDDGGIQSLINFRNSTSPFKVISVIDIEEKIVESHDIRDRIIIIAITDPTTRAPIKISHFSDRISGAEIQAHATSQIISSVLDKRTVISSPDEVFEYIWIIIFFSIGLATPVRSEKLRESVLKILFIIFISHLISYIFFVFLGYWISSITCTILLLFLGLLSFLSSLSSEITQRKEEQHKQDIIRRSNEQREIIERTFSIIHNGPLQTLSSMIRCYRDIIGNSKIIKELEELDEEIRCIGEFLKDDSFSEEHRFYLQNHETLDLENPIHDIFYQLYMKTVGRDLVGFKKLVIKLRAFDPISESYLTLETKRGLCLFLEGMLCNVEKHAVEATVLSAIGRRRKHSYELIIQDNGKDWRSKRVGEDTRHAKKLASLLNGTFTRTYEPENGMCCTLRWRLHERV